MCFQFGAKMYLLLARQLQCSLWTLNLRRLHLLQLRSCQLIWRTAWESLSSWGVSSAGPGVILHTSGHFPQSIASLVTAGPSVQNENFCLGRQIGRSHLRGNATSRPSAHQTIGIQKGGFHNLCFGSKKGNKMCHAVENPRRENQHSIPLFIWPLRSCLPGWIWSEW